MQFDGIAFFILAIAMGFFFSKWKLIPSGAADILPPVLLNVFFPALLFSSFSTIDTQELVRLGLPAVICTLVFSVLGSCLCVILRRKSPQQTKRLLRFIGGIGNTSFVCIPLMSFFLSAEEMVIVYIHGAVMDFIIWGIHHQIFRGGERNIPAALKKIFTSPCLIAVVLGIGCSVAKLELPSLISYPISTLAAAVSPLSLVFIGILIQNYGIFSWLRDKTAIFYTVWKVLILPTMVFGALYFLLPLQTVLVLTLLFASPGPISSVVWSKQYGGDAKLAVNCLIPSTLLYFLLAGIALFLLSSAQLLGV